MQRVSARSHEPDTVDVTAKAAEIASEVKNKFSKGLKTVGTGVSGFWGAKTPKQGVTTPSKSKKNSEEVIATIEQLAKLKEIGAITEEDFNINREELLSRL